MSSADRSTRSLAHLQNLIKRDSEAYREDFKLQYLHFQSQFAELEVKPDLWNKSLAENISFVSQVAQFYREETSNLSDMFINILRSSSNLLNKDIRLFIVRALILMRNRGLIDCIQLSDLFFHRLLQCQDKLLRINIQNHLINDIKKQNEKHKNHKLNNTLVNFLGSVIKENNVTAVKMALDIMISLYRKNIWNDQKTVNIIGSTCFSKESKIQVAALSFFLGHDLEKSSEENSDDSDQDEQKTKKEILLGHRVGKKSAKRKKKTERALRALQKQKSKKKKEQFDNSPLHLLYDPQEFVERLFRQLESSNERFEVKLLHQDLISRLIGVHQLILLNFYPYLQRYLQPHQRQVTKILLYLAQASHQLVPPDLLQSISKTIANNFITERNSSEVMAVGLNTIREISSRCYLAVDEDLIVDLSKYKSYRDKSVSSSARSLIQVFREKNPQILQRKDRGKPTEYQRELIPLDYGQTNVKSFIDGTEFLDPTEEKEKEEEEEENEDQSSSISSDQNEEWIDVQHSDEEEENEKAEDENDLPEITEEERKEKAMKISSETILTQEDFQKLKLIQFKKKIQDRRKNRQEFDQDKDKTKTTSTSKSNKRKFISIDTDSDSEGENSSKRDHSDLISLKDIEKVQRKRSHDKQSRLETVLAGREGRDKFGKWKKDKGRVGTTNKEKLKSKHFQMIKPKLRQKQKRSFRDKQISLRNALLKDKRLR